MTISVSDAKDQREIIIHIGIFLSPKLMLKERTKVGKQEGTREGKLTHPLDSRSVGIRTNEWPFLISYLLGTERILLILIVGILLIP